MTDYAAIIEVLAHTDAGRPLKKLSNLKPGNQPVCHFENQALSFKSNLRDLKSKFSQLFSGELPQENDFSN